MAQHQQLDVFHMQAAAATNKRAEQRPHGEIEKRESHAADPPSPRWRGATQAATRILAPFTPRTSRYFMFEGRTEIAQTAATGTFNDARLPRCLPDACSGSRFP